MAKPQKIKRINKLKLITSLPDAQAKTLSSYISSYDSDSSIDWKKSTLWRVTSEGGRGFIIVRYLRFLDKKKKSTRERLDRALYNHQKKNKHDCEEICRILNVRHQNRLASMDAWKIKSAFIKVQGGELSKKFEAYMFARSGNEKHSRRCRRMVEEHFLNYFYHERKPAIHDYLEWSSLKIQAEYMEYLFSKKVKSNRTKKKEVPLAAKTIRAILQYTNHFMRFIHIESEGNIPLIKMTFPSVTNARYVEHSQKRKKILPQYTPPKDQYIDEETYKKIYNNAPDDIKSCIWLSYHFGLRRSEVLALEPSNVRKSHLKVDYQLIALDIERDSISKKKTGINEKKMGPLKNRDEEGRKVNYWYATPDEAYKHIQSLQVMHPSVLSKKWIELMSKLKMTYTFHNLRNAFCSNALRDTEKLKISPVDVQLCLGHSDLRTTMQYLRDYRKLDDDTVWSPKMA